MNKFVMMLRVKDGILFIHKWLENIGKLVDEIVVVDNGSTDGTYEILKQHPKVVDITRTEGFHEGRDKIFLYDLARKRHPDWCMWLDVDEIFEQRVTRRHLDKLMSSGIVKRWIFRRFHLHGDDGHFESRRENIIEQAIPSRSMWIDQPAAHFSGAFIHDGDIRGLKGFWWFSTLRIKHLAHAVPGYKEYRSQKYKEVIGLDPDITRREMYLKNLDGELDDNYPTWNWYEYHERPLFVTCQNLFFTTIMFYKFGRQYAMIFRNRIIRR